MGDDPNASVRETSVAGDAGAPAVASAETMLGDDASAGESSVSLTQGGGAPRDAKRIGDYYVLHRVGAGAMGTVYAAYDPELDRKVAVKVLNDRASGDSVGRRRLQREARALARLSHPNVVTVHAVGEAFGLAWVAMAFVEGRDLAAWIQEGAHDWRAVLEVFVAAGRGLAAAHAADVIHRDFKPGNVLIGKDGQVRVADFGLARPAELEDERAPSPRLDASADVAASLEATSEGGGPSSEGRGLGSLSPSWTAGQGALTHTRGVVGTPMYMAPEQHLGSRVDAAADQYAYCLSLYEALYGELPFDGRSVIALVEAKHAGEFRAAPAGRDVPRWLRKIVLRGLAPEPSDRFASMQALLEEIEVRRGEAEGRGRRRLAWGLGAAAVVVAGVGGWALAGRTGSPSGGPAADPCAEAAARIEAAWDDERRASTRAAIEAVDVPFASQSAEQIVSALDDNAAAIAEMRDATCRARHAGELADEVVPLREACLDQHYDRFVTVRDIVAEPDRAVLESASELLGKTLERPRDCATPSWVVPARSPEVAARRREITGEVARVYALGLAGKTEAAAKVAEALEADFERIDDPGARGEVSRLLANRKALDDPEREALLQSAFTDGLRLRNFALAVFSGLDLAQTQLAGSRNEAALWTIDQSEAVWEAMEATARWREGPPPLEAGMRAQLDVLRGDALRALGQPQKAIEATKAGLERWETVPGFSGFKVNAHNNLAEALREAGRHDEAMAHYGQALDLAIAELGESSPRVATILNNRGGALIELGRFEAGSADLRRGRAIQVALDGETHPNIGLIDYNLAAVDLLEGREAEAETRLARAEKIWTGTLPPGHPFIAVGRMSQGTLARQRGQLDRALELGRGAVDGLKKTVGDTHPLTATALAELSLTEHARGDHGDAVRLAEAARAAFEASSGLETPNAAAAPFALGEALAGGGALDEATAAYEHAAKILLESGSPEHPELAWPFVGLAEVAVRKRDLEDAGVWLRRARAARDAHESPRSLTRRLDAVAAALD